MREVILCLLIAPLLAGVCKAQYSDASLDNAWIMAVSDVPGENSVFIIFDGEGGVTEFGAFRMLFPAGTYSVEQDGALVIDVEHEEGDQWHFDGQMIDEYTANIVIEMDDTLSFPMIKVMNEAACSGFWTGSFIQDSTQVTYVIEELVIDEWGVIQSCIGFAPPVTGRFYVEQDYFVGHFFTGEGEGWDEIGIESGTFIPNQTMTGVFSLECGDCQDGTFTLEYDTISLPDEKVSGFSLHQNHPNPFNPTTTIEFTLLYPQYVQLTVYSIPGQQVTTLAAGPYAAGIHQVRFDGSTVASGVYVYRLVAGDQVETRKMVLVR